jgi:hypothetical protein
MKPEDDNLEPLLNAKDVKKLLRCSLALVYKMADRGQLPCIRWECPTDGRRRPKSVLRFKRSDILAFVEGNYVTK